MNDISTPSPAPKKSNATVVIILIVLIVLILGIVFSIKGNGNTITPPTNDQFPAAQENMEDQNAGSPEAQIQNIDSLNADLDNQQFEGTAGAL